MGLYQNLVYSYTADDGDNFTRSQRIPKDENGNAVIPTPQFLKDREINTGKNKIWGNRGNSTLRKSTIIYSNENNNSGNSQLTINIPQNPQQGIVKSLKELKKICDDTFGGDYCFDYEGENRE